MKDCTRTDSSPSGHDSEPSNDCNGALEDGACSVSAASTSCHFSGEDFPDESAPTPASLPSTSALLLCDDAEGSADIDFFSSAEATDILAVLEIGAPVLGDPDARSTGADSAAAAPALPIPPQPEWDDGDVILSDSTTDASDSELPPFSERPRPAPRLPAPPPGGRRQRRPSALRWLRPCLFALRGWAPPAPPAPLDEEEDGDDDDSDAAHASVRPLPPRPPTSSPRPARRVGPRPWRDGRRRPPSGGCPAAAPPAPVVIDRPPCGGLLCCVNTPCDPGFDCF